MPFLPPYDVNIGALNPGDLIPSKPTSLRLTLPILLGDMDRCFPVINRSCTLLGQK